jgi:hypothetical protein
MKQILKTALEVGALALGAFTAGISAARVTVAETIAPHAQIMTLSGHHMAADADIGDGTSPNRKG